MLRQQDRGLPSGELPPLLFGRQSGNRNGCLWQPLYLKISNGFPLVFAARRNAAPAFGQQSGNRNSQPLLNAKAADSYLCGRKAWPQLCFAKTGRNLALTTIVSQKNGFGNRLGRENAFLSQIAKKTSCEKKRLSVLFSANPAVSNSNIIQWFLSNYFLRYFFKSILSFLTKKQKNVIMPSECSGRPCSRQP